MAVVAVLAPTNTGKTHRAVERMLESRTGMIGLPLRLLAREVYDRITARIGEAEVALLTGEEKRVPRAPRYFVCTVESMPMSRTVDFLAVDEIQLAAHKQRGHVFTDRLLSARGREETWFLGSETMRPLIRTLVPEADVRTHTRLSRLTYAGEKSLRALPPRSAVVGFSANQVYHIAERLRERRGGVAVVLGALSPRTRNAQVALYQAGEVQYLVATDAIGMGLNMDVDHVAFAALRKFDGRDERFLEADELAQIAGRAGRYQADGTFGTLSSVPALRPQVVRAIENHRFPAVPRLVWRNSDLDMRTVDTLLASLCRPPGHSALALVHHAEDYSALMRLAADPNVRTRAQGSEVVSLLWQVCQIPDFRKLLEDSHVRLLGEIFEQLSGPAGRLDADWMNRRIKRLDHVEGDIDTLMNRIAFIRTWTYISHHAAWVTDAEHWRERTRAIEDRLSDALHEGLMARFVAQKRLRTRRAANTSANTSANTRGPFSKLRDLFGDVNGAMARDPQELWVASVVEAGHDAFHVDAQGVIRFGDTVIGRLTQGVELLRPDVALTLPELGSAAHARITRRLTAWARDLVAEALEPLRREPASELTGAGRGLVYQLERGLGTIPRRQADAQVRALTDGDRQILRQLDVRVGRAMVYARASLTQRAVIRRLALNTAQLPHGVTWHDPRPGAPSMDVDPDIDNAAYTAVGYPVFGPRAIRADMAERVHYALASAGKAAERFVVPAELPTWIGCKRALVPDIVSAFGYRALDDGRFQRPAGQRPAGQRPAGQRQRQRRGRRRRSESQTSGGGSASESS